MIILRKRIGVLYICISLSFLLLFLRILFINNENISSTSEQQRRKTIEIASSRGKIYDRSLNLITDREERLIAAVSPAVNLLSIPALKDSVTDLEDKIRKGLPFTAEVKKEIGNEFVRTFKVSERYTDSLYCHLTGYLDSSKKTGLSGVEKVCNDYLNKNSGALSVSFETDAYGRALPGLNKYIYDTYTENKGGVVLTTDNKIQKICEDALEKSSIKSGCALVMHIGTGEIYAMASVPVYDRSNISESLNKEYSPLLNKALQSYSVGSVFKPLVCAFALQNGISKNRTYDCKGSVKIGDTVFRCYNGKAHGKQNMTEALENSCNTYFTSLIKDIDTDRFLSLLEKMDFSKSIDLGYGLTTSEGTLPYKTDLILPGQKANFSFGQGKLLLTPIHILSAYHALATGEYISPTVFYGLREQNGLIKKEKKRESIKIFSDKTVKEIRKMLSSVIENGNADKAKSTLLSLAGKTGTAQSGIYESKKEILRTWFAGFFPADNPHYIVVVMNEDGTGGNADCGEVFRKICEGIAMKS